MSPEDRRGFDGKLATLTTRLSNELINDLRTRGDPSPAARVARGALITAGWLHDNYGIKLDDKKITDKLARRLDRVQQVSSLLAATAEVEEPDISKRAAAHNMRTEYASLLNGGLMALNGRSGERV